MLYKIAGIVIIVFGLHGLVVFKIKALYQDTVHYVQKPRALGRTLFGTRMCFGWTPCICPFWLNTTLADSADVMQANHPAGHFIYFPLDLRSIPPAIWDSIISLAF